MHKGKCRTRRDRCQWEDVVVGVGGFAANTHYNDYGGCNVVGASDPAVVDALRSSPQQLRRMQRRWGCAPNPNFWFVLAAVCYHRPTEQIKLKVSSCMDEWSQRVRELTELLVSWPSVLDTPDEAAFAPRLYALLATWPYFQQHPEDLCLLPTHEPDRERWNLLALVRGAQPTTVALVGHYDTVPLDDYGALAPLATQPRELLPALQAVLAQEDRPDAALARQDLASGDFLPGRGALDMKSGLAIGLTLLERFAAQPARAGGLLFMTTPDEEGTSAGMRALAGDLPEWLATREVQLSAAINLDVSSDQGDGSAGQAVFLGSVGKLLAAVMLVGRTAHLGAPFEGISANLLAAELVRAVDYNPQLADTGGGECGPPPLTLRLQDTKTQYDVSTPQFTWCAINLLSYQRDPQTTLDLLGTTVAAALAQATALHTARAQAHAAQAGLPSTTPISAGRVYTFAELQAYVAAQGGAAALAAVAAAETAATAVNQGDAFAQLRVDQAVIEALWQQSGLSGPAAVVSFVGPHYPLVALDTTTVAGAQLLRVIERQIAQIRQATGSVISLRPLFAGISDMSFLARPTSTNAHTALLANMPAASTRARIERALRSTLDVPVVNIGPWGRDYHQRTERLFMPYAFTTLPELLWRIVNDLHTNTSDKGATHATDHQHI
jgi:arginine utilization protein RocB